MPIRLTGGESGYLLNGSQFSFLYSGYGESLLGAFNVTNIDISSGTKTAAFSLTGRYVINALNCIGWNYVGAGDLADIELVIDDEVVLTKEDLALSGGGAPGALIRVIGNSNTLDYVTQFNTPILCEKNMTLNITRSGPGLAGATAFNVFGNILAVS